MTNDTSVKHAELRNGVVFHDSEIGHAKRARSDVAYTGACLKKRNTLLAA